MQEWPHAPPHRLLEPGTYMVTASTYQKEHFFKGEDRLAFMQDSLLKYARDYGWKMEAWAVFPNHYHFIASCSEKPESLAAFVKVLHQTTARYINEVDKTPQRQVWFQFWETYLTFAPSFFTRLKYVHHNAVHHGIVKAPEDYPWCSAAWFIRNAPPSFRKTVERFKIDTLKVLDDF